MRIVDLFCGCGGMSLGFQSAGHDVAVGMDFWDSALAVYEANFDHPALKIDLSKVNEVVPLIKEFHPQMIIGGPPCQDFSSAGKRNENNGRGDLTVDYAKIISQVRPKWFVMENVARILKTQKLIEAREIFHQSGYGLTQTILDASLCGVPQARKRFVLIGCLDQQDDFIFDTIKSRLGKKQMTVAEYFGEELDIKYYYRHPRSYQRRGIFSVDEPSPTIRGVNRPVPVGYPIHPGDATKSTDGLRPLTTEERSRIQTFPKEFKFLGTKTDKEQMIGNAVPVNLAKYIGDCINTYICDNPSSAPAKVNIPSVEQCMSSVGRRYRPYEINNGIVSYRLFEPTNEYDNDTFNQN
ncbi:MAG: DNA cytosine methyltransferase [Muribaculaceae bacterium]|nr:DNA cytosine methyltransferase [Muribaculaceae bacterium]